MNESQTLAGYHAELSRMSALDSPATANDRYKQGKENGLMESTHGGEIAVLRERIRWLENSNPISHRNGTSGVGTLGY